MRYTILTDLPFDGSGERPLSESEVGFSVVGATNLGKTRFLADNQEVMAALVVALLNRGIGGVFVEGVADQKLTG